MAPTTSAWAVILTGTTCGGLVKGCSGFGSAIILVLVWVFLSTCRIDGGPLQTVVMTDAVVTAVAAIPMVIMSEAHRHLDWRLVIPLTLGKAATSPLGAAALKVLNRQVVELIMACTLLLLLCLSCDAVSTRLKQLSRRWTPELGRGDSIKAGQLLSSYLPHSDWTSGEVRHSTEALPLMAGRAQAEADLPPSCLAPDAAPGPRLPPPALLAALAPLLQGQPCGPAGGEEGQAAGGTTPGRLMHPASPLSQTHRHDQDREALQLALVVRPADGPAYSVNQGVGVDATARVGTPTPRDIPKTVAEDGQAYDTDRQASAGKGGTSDAASGPGFWRLVARGQWQAVRQAAWAFARQRDNQVLVGAACLAGITSGLMDGLTGMGGPPIMLLYTCLDTPKAVARAVGAVVNLTQIRLLAYWSLGMLHQEDMLMFGSASVLHLAACTLGALVLFQRLDQKRFGQLLFALMLTCCFLLFAAATGLTGGE
ncbi:hypothetical protein V8C86DRAFT_2565397 [Haematococcus lacustris]